MVTMPSSRSSIVTGQVRAQRVLGTDAVYRVLALGEEIVHVEVIRAPGLPAGRALTLTRKAVLAMRVCDDTGTAPDSDHR
jgi:hypothetical protein